MKMSYEKMLPSEVWQKILLDVSPVDLCSVAMTSIHMNDMASWPDLWAGMKVNIGKLFQKGLKELYSIDRFKKVRKVDLSEIELNSEEIERILQDIPGSPLKHLDLSNRNLSKVSTELLVRVVSGLESLDLWSIGLTTDQCVKLLEASILSKTLVNIDLGLYRFGSPAYKVSI